MCEELVYYGKISLCFCQKRQQIYLIGITILFCLGTIFCPGILFTSNHSVLVSFANCINVFDVFSFHS